MGLKSKSRGICTAVALVVAAVGLSGCFDVVQTVSVGRDGSGRYQVAASGQGFVGEALKNEKMVNRQNHATLTTSNVNGTVTRTATVDFKSLSELAFSDETMTLNVTGRDFFGLIPAHAALATTVMIDKAKSENHEAAAASGVGEQLARSVLGDHTYVFSVTVPGSVDRAVPITIGDQTYEPTVTGDIYNGHTVTWKIPLYAFVTSRALKFEVDYWAWGSYAGARSQLVAND